MTSIYLAVANLLKLVRQRMKHEL